MTITKIFDAAYPPASAPAGCKGVLGYIGGPNAYHTWTLEEWQPFSHLVQFPCWVPELTGNPEAQAAAAVAAAKQLGWAAHEPAASERAIIFDLETLSNATWWQTCAAAVSDGGFIAVAYGSLSTVLLNAASDVWVGNWKDGVVPQAGQTVHGTQYQANAPFNGTFVDYSVIDEWLMARGGVGPRHA